MTNKDRINNENLYLLTEEYYGDFNPLAEELETFREGQLIDKLRQILIANGHQDAKELKTFKSIITKIESLGENERIEMGLNRDILKVGKPPKGDEGKCPYCGSENIARGYPKMESGSRKLYYKCSCNKCNKPFKVWYRPIYIETTPED